MAKQFAEVLGKIAFRLAGIHTDDMSAAERQICQILIEADFGQMSENGEFEKK